VVGWVAEVVELEVGSVVEGALLMVEEEDSMSASRPKMKHIVLMVIPIMVRNWRCQPYEKF
jgi:hypothetical protein